MIAFIEEVIAKFGGRPAGSDAERKAQLFVQERCEQITDKVEFIPFDEYLDARFGKLKYYVAIYLLALGTFWLWPAVALVIALINDFFIVFDLMMYRDVLTNFPGKKQTSSNVVATLEPLGEVKSTLIVSGHIDSTREYTWWYRLGAAGVTLTLVAGFLIVLLPLFIAVHLVSPHHFDLYIWSGFAVLSPILIVFWSMHGSEPVQGAQDNLSGISIALSVFETLADKGQKGRSLLKNTRVKFVSFGSEERGLLGSRAYARMRREELHNENAHLLNIDGVRLVNEVAIVERELMNGTRHSENLITGLESSFRSLQMPHKRATVPFGGTDGVSFARIGLPSVSLIGMSTKEYDFTYHTRNDLVEHIEPQALENVKSALLHFIERWDSETLA